MKRIIAVLSLSLLSTAALAQGLSPNGGSSSGGAPTGPAGGSLGGTYPNPTVVTNANLTGDVTSVGNASTLAASISGTKTFSTSLAIGAGSAITSSGAGGTLGGAAFVTPGTGVSTALGVNVGTAGAFVVLNGAGGTPSSLVGTNITGTAAGLTAGNVTTNANLTGPISSTGNATSITSQTGTGTKFVVDTSPTFAGVVTHANGTVNAPSINLGDATSGFYRPASNVVAIATNGVLAGYYNASQQFGLGVGASFADAPLTVNIAGGATPVATAANVLAHFVADAGTNPSMQFDGFGTSNAFFFGQLTGGTRTSPAAAGAGALAFSILAKGYDGVSAFGNLAFVDFMTLNATSTSDHSGQVRIRTGTAGSAGAPTQRVLVQQGLIVGSGTTDPGANNLIVGGTVTISGIASDTATTDNTVCITSAGLTLKGSGTLGICLGTSSERYKPFRAPLSAGLSQIMALKPIRYTLDSAHGDPDKILYGFTAEQGGAVLPDLLGRDNLGRPNTFDYLGVVPVLVRAVQEQQAEITQLKVKLESKKEN